MVSNFNLCFQKCQIVICLSVGHVTTYIEASTLPRPKRQALFSIFILQALRLSVVYKSINLKVKGQNRVINLCFGN